MPYNNNLFLFFSPLLWQVSRFLAVRYTFSIIMMIYMHRYAAHSCHLHLQRNIDMDEPQIVGKLKNRIYIDRTAEKIWHSTHIRYGLQQKSDFMRQMRVYVFAGFHQKKKEKKSTRDRIFCGILICFERKKNI